MQEQIQRIKFMLEELHIEDGFDLAKWISESENDGTRNHRERIISDALINCLRLIDRLHDLTKI